MPLSLLPANQDLQCSRREWVYHSWMQQVVTLIHGTWAVNAPWLNEDSLLCKAVREALAGEVIFAPFHWSGRNSFRDRMDAAADLSEHLLEQQQKYPSANHFAIAHSHGGNVLLRLLEDEDCPPLKATVFLSTPFLIPQERPKWHKQLALTATAIDGLVISAFYIGTHGAFSMRLFTLVCVITFASTFFFLSRIFNHTVAAARMVQLSVAKQMEHKEALILRCDRDEAAYGLTTLQFLSAVLIKIQRNLPRLWLSVLFYCTLVLSVLHFFRFALGDNILLICFMIVPSLVVIVSSGTMVAMALGLGIEFVLASMVLDISVESTPLGIWTVCQIRPSLDPVHLRHSMSYEDEDALKAIADWLKSHA